MKGMVIVECETLYREIYFMSQEELDRKDFSEAEIVLIEACDIPTVISVSEEE